MQRVSHDRELGPAWGAHQRHQQSSNMAEPQSSAGRSAGYGYSIVVRRRQVTFLYVRYTVVNELLADPRSLLIDARASRGESVGSAQVQ
jgi:hypothetical protein